MGPGPLSGVRVVELAGLGPAPFAGMMLAELGADVVKVDRPAGGGIGIPPEHDLLNRGRPSVCVDLKHPQGVETVRRLVDTADIFIEGFRPGVAERIGLGPDDLLTRRPALVYGRMTGWGQDGPMAGCAGHDINYIGVTGDLHAIGGPDKPMVPLNLVGDFGGGAMYLVVGVLAALHETRASGQGQVVDAAVMDGSTHLATMVHGLAAAGMWGDQRASNLLDGGAPFYDVFATSDGRHMAVGPLEPQFYDELLRLLVLPEPPPAREQMSEWPRLHAMVAARFLEQTQAEWTAVFEGSDACVTPVLPLAEAPYHPQMAARGTLTRHEGVTQPMPAPRFSRTTTELGAPPPAPGQDSRSALLRWGLDDVDSLLAAGVVVQHEEER
ncbi:MAG: CaiB/BaiF CoA transferase family protein [Nocardioidaceae bacterium]